MEQEIKTLIPKTTSASVVARFDSEIAIANKRADSREVSVFEGQPPATDDDIDRELFVLRNVFEQTPTFYGVLKHLIHETGMSAERLHFCVTNFLLTHTYGKSFTPAELLSIDQKIVVARTQQGLRSKIKHQLEYEDIVIVEFDHDRRYALTDDAEKFGLNILARFRPNGTLEWVGTYDNPNFKKRQHDFGVKVGKYQNYYPREMCIAFYRYWSQPVQCGDMMLKEIKWSTKRIDSDGRKDDLIGEYIDQWAIEHGYPSRFITQEEYEKSKS